MEQRGERAEGLAVEGSVGEDEDFEVDALSAWEPVELLKDRGRCGHGSCCGFRGRTAEFWI